MATRLRIDHDLDPNAHRLLGCRGVDLLFSSSGDLTLGQGNGFRVAGADGATTLRRIATGNWLQASAIDLQFVADTSIVSGAAGSGGYAGIVTPTGETLAISAGLIARFVLFGDSWVAHTVSSADIVTEITNNPTVINNLTNSVVTYISNNPTYITEITGALPTPSTVASTLFPTEVRDPLRRRPIRGVFSFSEGSTFLGAMVPVAGTMDTLVATDGSLLLTYRGSLIEPVPAVAGDLGLMWENSGTGQPGYWVYEVLDPGGYRFSDGRATIRRAFDSNTSATVCVGAFCQVTGGPELEYNGEFFRITSAGTLGTTPIVIEELTTDPATETYRALLTSPQCTSLGASSDTLLNEVTVDNWTNAQFFRPDYTSVPYFWTRGLNRTTLLAGIYQVTAKVTVTGGDVGALTVLETAEYVRHSDGSFEAPFVGFNSPPLPPGTSVQTFQGLLAAAVSCAPTDELAWALKVHTNSATPVTVVLTWQDPGRTTRLTVPFELTITGASTGRHPDLSLRNAPLQHPASSSYPVVGDSIGAGLQWLWPSNGEPFGDRCSFRRYSLTGDAVFQGIAKTWSDGTPIPDGFEYRVFIPNASPENPVRVVRGAAPPVGSQFLPFALPATNGVVHPLTLSGPTMLWFWLDLPAGYWRLDHAVTYALIVS
jgi:hypothetical protein